VTGGASRSGEGFPAADHAELRPVTAGMRLGDLPELLASLPRLGAEEAAAFEADLTAARAELGSRAEAVDPGLRATRLLRSAEQAAEIKQAKASAAKSSRHKDIEDPVEPHVLEEDLSAGYTRMAFDEAQEAEADEWSNALMAHILKLNVAERIQLVADIWDSIAAAPDALELSLELREELDRRLSDHEANPGAGQSWSEVKSRLLDSP
jgi:putative addiction module component (TIGR02574 family)